jgi:hypothetical protein
MLLLLLGCQLVLQLTGSMVVLLLGNCLLLQVRVLLSLGCLPLLEQQRLLLPCLLLLAS